MSFLLLIGLLSVYFADSAEEIIYTHIRTFKYVHVSVH